MKSIIKTISYDILLCGDAGFGCHSRPFLNPTAYQCGVFICWVTGAAPRAISKLRVAQSRKAAMSVALSLSVIVRSKFAGARKLNGLRKTKPGRPDAFIVGY